MCTVGFGIWLLLVDGTEWEDGLNSSIKMKNGGWAEITVRSGWVISGVIGERKSPGCDWQSHSRIAEPTNHVR